MIELAAISMAYHLAASLGLAFAITAVGLLGALAVVHACLMGAGGWDDAEKTVTVKLPRMWAMRKGRR